MRGALKIWSVETPGVHLRSIQESDLESLRAWKNANRLSFFYQEIISPEQQQEWYQGYCARPHDYMFMIVGNETPVGCMAFRHQDAEVDIYNVIRGTRQSGGRGEMAAGLRLMCGYAALTYPGPQRARVLSSNPALPWYIKHGFTSVSRGVRDGIEYQLIELQSDKAGFLEDLQHSAIAANA